MKKTEEKIEIPIEEIKTSIIEKIECLKFLASQQIIDEESTTIGEYQNMLMLFDEIDRGIIKRKIMKLVNDL